jgi:hypothetical protein
MRISPSRGLWQKGLPPILRPTRERGKMDPLFISYVWGAFNMGEPDQFLVREFDSFTLDQILRRYQ